MKNGLILILAAIIFTGCTDNQKLAQDVSLEGSGAMITMQDVSTDDIMQQAKNVLVSIGFEITKYDTEQGFIMTAPLRGGQFFEFWRHDNVGKANWLESNIHSIRRTVEFKVLQTDAGAVNQCFVYNERLSLPEREVAGTSDAYAIFTKSSESQQRFKLTEKQAQGIQWIDAGMDQKLAKNILGKIDMDLNEKAKGSL